MGEKVEATQKEATEKKVIIDANDKQKKVDEGPITVVLKLDLHCDGCAKKVKKSVRYIEGVESVNADSKGNKLTITGKVNPMHIKERVEYKTKKKVEIISPKPKKDDDKKAAGDKPAAATEAKSNEQKPKEPQSTSVVLKIPLHCDGCIQKIKRIILKIDGVESVKPDGNKNLVTVTGTMNMKELVPYLKDKLKRNVDVVVPPKKEEDKGTAVEKKDETKVEGGEKKKKDEKKAEGNETKKEKEGDNTGELGKKKNDVAKEADKIKSVVKNKKNDEEGKVASGGESEKNKAGGEATSTGGSGDAGDHGGKNNVNVMNKLEYYRHDPAYTYTMPPVMYNQSYHDQDYGVPVFPSQGYGNEGYVNHGGYGMMMGYHGPPPPPSPMSIHNYPPAAGASENDVFSADNPNACSIM